MNINITVGKDGPEASLAGPLTFAAHRAFRSMLDEHVAKPGSQRLLLDLAQVDHMDSAGLGMLLLAREAADKQGRTVALRGARGQVARLLEISKFDLLFTLIP